MMAFVLLLILLAVPVGAHHSFAAEYDVNKPVTLNGRVTKIEWTNPHVHLYVDVTDTHGHIESWNVEMGSPNGLAQKGWTRKSLNVGDRITVEGSRAKDGSNGANAHSIVLANGVRMPAASSGGRTS